MTKKTPTPTVAVSDLVADPENRRTHDARNLGMVADALRHVGAARSIVIDERNVVLAGNGVTAAAGEAGITRVRVIDATGDELIAVRRTGLTDEQKRALAMYDNRTAELAAWSPVQLEADIAAGLTFEPWFNDAELERITERFAVDEVGVPTMADGEKSPFQQMTFSLHDDQVATVKTAIEKAKTMGGGDAADNENRNGNALAFVCAWFLRLRAGAHFEASKR